jgi:hypothetical protein
VAQPPSFAEAPSNCSARRPRSRKLALALGIAGAALTALLGAAPAGAVITSTFGVHHRKAPLVEARPLQYHGGPVLHSSDAYVIYWDPTGGYRGDWERLIDKYFQNVGSDSGSLGNVFAVDRQYGDATGQASNGMTFRGSYTDSTPYPTTEDGGNCSEPAAFVCLTDAQVKAEVLHVINSVAPPLPGATGTPVYYLLTPPGVTVCTGSGSASTCSNSHALEEEVSEIEENKTPGPVKTGICGYHSFIEGATKVPYVVQPWVAGSAGRYILSSNPLVTSPDTPDVLSCQDNAQLNEPNQTGGLNEFGNYAEGLADVIVSNLSVEQQNVVVDPFLTGWYQDTTQAEQGDMCQFDFGPGPTEPEQPNKETHAISRRNETINGNGYYVPWAFDSADLTAGKGFSCWSGVTIDPYFTAANPVNAGDIVGFNSESQFTLAANTKGLPSDEPYIASVYTWDFGDGTKVSGPQDASEFHSYRYGGDYTVTLTIKDSGGNVGQTTRTITVVGPPPPGAEGSAGSTGSTSTTTTSPTGTVTAPGAGSPVVTPVAGEAAANPVATATIVSRSLKTAARKGLKVSYSVNEQVAGRFEVLISRSVAKRLGISGPAASGLAAGASAQVVLAKAILITTRAGRSTVAIQFSKAIARRLVRSHKLTFTLRLVVRNAASHSPATTTVMTAATLSH